MAYAQVSEEDLALPISAVALRILVLLRIRCWSFEGPKGRELRLADIRRAIGEGGRVRQGREAVAAALTELVQQGLVTATSRPGNIWRLTPNDAPEPVPDEALPARFRRRTPEQKSAQPTSRNRLSRVLEIGSADRRSRLSRSQKSAQPIAEVGSADRRNRLSRSLSDDVDLVDPADQVAAADGSAPAAAEISHGVLRPAERPSTPRPTTPREDLEELKRRHGDFLLALPEGPKRLRVVWLVGTPSELAEGLRREVEWVGTAMFGGDLESARRVVLEVFEHAWRRAYDGELPERWLAKSLWGQAFRARVREWADAQQQRGGGGEVRGDEDRSGPGLTYEQLVALASAATERLKGGKTA